MATNLHSGVFGETVKQFLKRRDVRFCGKTFRQHHQMQQSLVKKGFVVREIERLEGNPLWWLILSPGNVTNGTVPRVIQQLVSETLNELGCRRRPREVSVMIDGEKIIVDFVWRAGKGGVVTFYYPPLRS